MSVNDLYCIDLTGLLTLTWLIVAMLFLANSQRLSRTRTIRDVELLWHSGCGGGGSSGGIGNCLRRK